jgi:hypothetical protein
MKATAIRGGAPPPRGEQRPDGNSGRGIPTRGFEDDRLRRDSDLAKLLGDKKAMRFVANDDGGLRPVTERPRSQQRLLEQRALGYEW